MQCINSEVYSAKHSFKNDAANHCAFMSWVCIARIKSCVLWLHIVLCNAIPDWLYPWPVSQPGHQFILWGHFRNFMFLLFAFNRRAWKFLLHFYSFSFAVIPSFYWNVYWLFSENNALCLELTLDQLVIYYRGMLFFN